MPLEIPTLQKTATPPYIPLFNLGLLVLLIKEYPCKDMLSVSHAFVSTIPTMSESRYFMMSGSFNLLYLTLFNL